MLTVKITEENAQEYMVALGYAIAQVKDSSGDKHVKDMLYKLANAIVEAWNTEGEEDATDKE